MKIELPEKVKMILDRLEANGWEGYAVGGCVRDSIMGRTPSDWDIATSAPPGRVKEIFPHTFDTGIAHGTVTVLMGREGFEVTTYRIDGEYQDSRHPREVTYTSRLEEDLKRRDFTVNAMAYNERAGLVDLFGGCQDLEEGRIRCVGQAGERFGEDALRMMRAVRFCAQLGFSLEEQTADAIRAQKSSLRRISAERIQTELVKLLVSPHPGQLRQAFELGITGVVLPEFDRMMEQPQNSAHHAYSVGEHTLRALEASPQDKVLRLTMLFHDTGKPEIATRDQEGIYHFRGHAARSAVIARQTMKRLKFDNDTARQVCRLVEKHSMYPELTPESVRRAVFQVGEDLFPAFLQVKRADIMGQHPQVRERKLAYLDQVRDLYEGILQRGECLSLKALAVTGNDLIKAGLKPGKSLGRVLEELLDQVLEDPGKNSRAYLLEEGQRLWSAERETMQDDPGKAC